MKKNEIATARAREVERLTEKYTHDFAVSQNLMNRYYRVCGALNRLLILENTETTCNEDYTRNLGEKTKNAVERLKIDFEKYGLTFVFYGFLPTITDKKGNNEKIYTFFY